MSVMRQITAPTWGGSITNAGRMLHKDFESHLQAEEQCQEPGSVFLNVVASSWQQQNLQKKGLDG